MAAKSLGVERAAYAALIQEMWPEIVGAEAAARSRPGALRGDTLLAEVEAGMWAQELSARRGQFTAEINRRLGTRVIADIRFTQVAGWPKARPEEASSEGPRGAEPELTAEEQAAIERATEEIGDPEIREAARRAMTSQARWRKQHVRPPGR